MTAQIKYICINYGKTLKAEFPPMEQPKLAITFQTILATVPPTEYRRQTVEDNDINYHYFSNSSGYIFCCATTKNFRGKIAFAVLDDIEKSSSETSYDQTNFKFLLVRKFELYNNPVNDKIILVQNLIDDAKDKMIDNMDKALKRGEQFDALYAKSEDLVKNAQSFQEDARKFKRNIWHRNAQFAAMIVGIVIALILIILIIVCKPNFSSC